MMTIGQIFWAEVRREGSRLRTYYVEFFAAQAFFVLAFLLLSGLFSVVAKGQYSVDAQLLSLIGYFVWLVADGSFMRIVQSYADDASWGTLEQAWLCPVSPGFLLFVRAIVTLLSSTLRALIAVGVILLLIGQSAAPPASSIIVFIVTQLGVVGLALAVVGIQYVNKSVQSITTVISFLLLFVTGAISPLPTDTMIYQLGKWLPLGMGVSLLREVAVKSVGIHELVLTSEFWALLILSSVYLLVGWLILRWGQKTALIRGILGHY
jgi:ABC-2 type transport system permease protein